MVDAAFPVPDGDHGMIFYVWSGTKYGKYHFIDNTHESSSGQHDTRSTWETFKAADWGAVDAVVGVPDQPYSFFVFFGGRYFRAQLDPKNNLKDSFEDGHVKTIKSSWQALADCGFHTIDMGIPDPFDNDYIYFFSGTKTLRYHYSRDEVLGPQPISRGWPAFAKGGFDSVDAIFRTGGKDSNIYIVFRGDQYLETKWVLGEVTLVSGPKLIKDSYPFLKDWV